LARVDIDYRDLLAHYATGVVVVTTRVDGEDHAMTANSFTSVSLTPPLVLICVQRDSRFHAAIAKAGVWVVNIVTADQAPAARWFAEKGRPLAGQLNVVEHHRGEDDIARLTGCIGYLTCDTEAVHPGGDHSIVVGRVREMELNDTGASPLLYLNHRLGPASSGVG
jgi:flavin reductase (DIM6/NTAB) family NADH-FMN oxidoreductase RutF